jgi:nicotinic acid mononucleotide adenylyltransferase
MNAPIAELADLFAGQSAALCRKPDGTWSATAALPAALLPGAFNPLHDGHRRLAEVAGTLLGGPVAFELSVLNVDKPPLTEAEVRRRLSAFSHHQLVWVTRAATFEEKARIFPQAIFVVGTDTADRIVAARYYAESVARMHAALDEIARHGCRFLVAGRVDQTGRFVELGQLSIPATYAELFQAIPRDTFQLDISSTRLRDAAEHKPRL